MDESNMTAGILGAVEAELGHDTQRRDGLEEGARLELAV